MTTLFAAVHHLAILALLVCTLLTLHQLRQPFSVPGARLLSTTDMVNGLAATLVLLVGLVRVFYFEKGAAYYFHNAPFLAKLGFYGLASVLSVIPTLEVYRWRKPLKSGLLPTVSAAKMTTLRTVAVLQLACLAAMVVCANLAARGIDWQ
jgi:putative membrane protein